MQAYALKKRKKNAELGPGQRTGTLIQSRSQRPHSRHKHRRRNEPARMVSHQHDETLPRAHENRTAMHALGMLWLCSWLAAAATTPQRRSTLLYNHNPKAGGGTILQVLRRATPCEHLVDRNAHRPWWEDKTRNESCYVNVREAQASGRGDQRQAFVLGSVREPCDHYVSLWAFGSAGLGGWQKHGSQFHGKDRPRFDSARDVAAFRKWLRAPKISGVVAARFRDSYQDKNDAMFVDCWVRTEDLAATLLDCLRRFERQGGAIRWSRLQDFVRSAAPSRRLYESKNVNFSSDQLDPRLLHHAPCDTYYARPDKTYVERHESFIFQTFGYEKCCDGRVRNDTAP